MNKAVSVAGRSGEQTWNIISDHAMDGHMEFTNRLKKEMAEGVVCALLEDAQYRVIPMGIEKVLRELCCLSRDEYKNLKYPEAMSQLPDFAVMNRDQKIKWLVEVKYRSRWSGEIFDEVKDQVACYGEMALVCINAGAEDPKHLSANGSSYPSRYLRCCSLKMEDGIYQVEGNWKKAQGGIEYSWKRVDEVRKSPNLWWAMLKMHEKFPQLNEEGHGETLVQAMRALTGILDDDGA